MLAMKRRMGLSAVGIDAGTWPILVWQAPFSILIRHEPSGNAGDKPFGEYLWGLIRGDQPVATIGLNGAGGLSALENKLPAFEQVELSATRKKFFGSEMFLLQPRRKKFGKHPVRCNC